VAVTNASKIQRHFPSGIPVPRLAILPNTTHITLMERMPVIVPMVNDFFDAKPQKQYCTRRRIPRFSLQLELSRDIIGRYSDWVSCDGEN
jgi:hypothetical protein